MIKLTTDHIEAIRRYFLSPNEEEQVLIQNSITASSFSSFLPELKQIFNSSVRDDANLISIANSMGAEEHLETLKEIQRDYYSQLAILYNSGMLNPDIETLVKVGNADFLNEVNFQKELKLGFLLNERAALKKRFQEIDKESAISQEEIRLAFKLEERQKLKEQFQAIENESTQALKPTSRVVHFNWRQFAIAASVIGVAFATTFIIFEQNKKKQNIASTSNNGKRYVADSIAHGNLMQKRVNDLLAIKTTPSEEKRFTVLKQRSLGFATKEERITIREFVLHQNIAKIDAEISSDIKEVTGSDPILSLLKEKRDSLNNLMDKYSFYNDTLSVYLLSKRVIKLFKMDAAYYMQIDGDLYECKRSADLFPFRKLTDKTILKMIEQIQFINSN